MTLYRLQRVVNLALDVHNEQREKFTLLFCLGSGED